MPKSSKGWKKRKGVKTRKSSAKHGAWSVSKRQRFGAGPLGGVRPGRFGTTQTVSQSPGWPDRMFITLKRTFHGTIGSGTAGAFTNSPIKLNSAHDPLGAIVSTPPTGFAAFLGTVPALYSAYIVHAARVQIQTVWTSSTTPVMSMTARPASMAAPTSCQQAAGQPRGKCALMDIYKRNVMSYYCTVGQIYGQSPETVAIADSFSALNSADPASEVLLDVSLQDPAATTQQVTNCQIQITQWIECFGRVVQA